MLIADATDRMVRMRSIKRVTVCLEYMVFVDLLSDVDGRRKTESVTQRNAIATKTQSAAENDK